MLFVHSSIDFEMAYLYVLQLFFILIALFISFENSQCKNEQGKKQDYGELQMLENALANGAPPCFNMGINILRTLALCNELKIKDYDVFAFSRLKLGKQRGE